MTAEVYFPDLVRVIDDRGSSHVEPELDQDWDELTKLQWNAAVARVDSGIAIQITEINGCYAITLNTPGHSVGFSSTTYNQCWRDISKLSLGYETAKRDLL